MSDAMQAVQKDAPVMVAWNNYKSCDEFKNARKWALHEEHVDGSLWAAFYAKIVRPELPLIIRAAQEGK